MCKIVAVLRVPDDGKDLSLHTGEGLTIELEEMASAGYVWQSSLEPKGVLALQNSTRSPQENSGAGGSMLRTMTFCAESPGTVQVKLELKRPWEKSGQVAKTFQIHVTTEKPSAK